MHASYQNLVHVEVIFDIKKFRKIFFPKAQNWVIYYRFGLIFKDKI
jgi:hypothetical protein